NCGDDQTAVVLSEAKERVLPSLRSGRQILLPFLGGEVPRRPLADRPPGFIGCRGDRLASGRFPPSLPPIMQLGGRQRVAPDRRVRSSAQPHKGFCLVE